MTEHGSISEPQTTTKADAKVKEGLEFLKKFYDERATLHKEMVATRNGKS